MTSFLKKQIQVGNTLDKTFTCFLKTHQTNGSPCLKKALLVTPAPLLLTFRFQSGLLLLGGGERRPRHADGQ